jgi:hypothetical protein
MLNRSAGVKEVSPARGWPMRLADVTGTPIICYISSRSVPDGESESLPRMRLQNGSPSAALSHLSIVRHRIRRARRKRHNSATASGLAPNWAALVEHRRSRAQWMEPSSATRIRHAGNPNQPRHGDSRPGLTSAKEPRTIWTERPAVAVQARRMRRHVRRYEDTAERSGRRATGGETDPGLARKPHHYR